MVDNGTLAFDTASGTDFAGDVSGMGALTKTGGILYPSGASTYTGGTTIASGTLGIRPDLPPRGERSTWSERLAAVRDIWAPLLLFVLAIGGLAGGCSRRRRPAAWGRATAS